MAAPALLWLVIVGSTAVRAEAAGSANLKVKRSVSCERGVHCKDFRPDERIWNVNYVQFAYEWRTPQWRAFDSDLTFAWASRRTTDEIRRIVDAIGSHIQVFVWGLKTKSLTLEDAGVDGTLIAQRQTDCTHADDMLTARRASQTR
jgi:hypothetical protein